MTPSERGARAYCESIGADPDEMVSGYWDTGNGTGRTEWLRSQRWTFYRGANPEWNRPLTAYERARNRQQPRGGTR